MNYRIKLYERTHTFQKYFVSVKHKMYVFEYYNLIIIYFNNIMYLNSISYNVTLRKLYTKIIY